MAWSAVCKLLQRRSIDLLSQRNGLLIGVLGFFLIFLTVFHFGEVLVAWSTEKYAAMFNSFSDNIGGQSFRKRLCLPVPIDVVYTWVNGSDPLLISQLIALKLQMTTELGKNSSTAAAASQTQCTFLHCVPAYGLTVEPAIPPNIGLRQFGILYPAFKDADKMFVVEDTVKQTNLTAVMFETDDLVKSALESEVIVQGKRASLKRLYYTSDRTLQNAVHSTDTLVLTGFPHDQDEVTLKNILTQKYDARLITRFVLHADRGAGVVRVSDESLFKAMSQDKNMTGGGKTLTLSPASLVWDLTDYSQSEDISASRFADNEELRYSLRSVEKYAPWVRRIFIVTNGQIPSWLNLDNPRLTVVTHEELFVNQSHLPTFSSPAIESHLHRIDGLSDKFVYLNDDVMFGKEVWPDDFFTEAGGQKVYLTWPVPNCRDGCPASWINDGFCDRSCNNSDCEWDGGDCAGTKVGPPVYGGVGQAHGSHWISSPTTYCNPGCANNWIADKYCDQACNVRQCGFDAADCGTDNFNSLFRVDLSSEKSEYSAEGHNPIYFNYASLVSESDVIDEGHYDEDDVVRSLSIAQKFKVVTLVMYDNRSATVLNVSLSGRDTDALIISFNFTVSVDTSFESKAVAVVVVENTTKIESKEDRARTSVESSIVFVPENGQKSAMPKFINVSIDEESSRINLSALQLPDDLRNRYSDVIRQLEDGELTETGFRRQVSLLWKKFLESFVMGNVFTIRINRDSRKATNDSNTLRQIDLSKLKMTAEDPVPVVSRAAQMDGLDVDGEKKRIKVRREATDSETDAQNPPLLVKKKSRNDKKKRTIQGRFSSRKLQAINGLEKSTTELDGDRAKRKDDGSSSVPSGSLPWEKLGIFDGVQRELDRLRRKEQYYVGTSSPGGRRRLLDTFANSLRHVSKIYNRAYGYVPRKVPAHIAHMVDKNVMAEMQGKFPDDWDATSSHRIRSGDDMQFAFAYFYYLMSESTNATVADVFGELDADRTGVLSDRELRTLAARLFELPLDLHDLVRLEEMLINCSKAAAAAPNATVPKKTQRRVEVYYENRLPQVTLELLEGCDALNVLLRKQMTLRTKYRYQVVGDDEVAFKMIRHNASNVVAQLDEVRKTPKKFICLNDNVDYGQESSKVIKAVLRDFYESVLPVPSSFELSREFRNKFLNMKDLRAWWRYREWTRWCSYLILLVLVLFALLTFFYDRIAKGRRRIFRW